MAAPLTMRRAAFALTVVASTCLGASGAFAQGYVCAEGGGSASAPGWSRAVFGWMVEHAPGGSVVILGSSGKSESAEAAFLRNGAKEVKQFAVRADEARDLKVAEAVAAADIVWMRGGRQSRYVAEWAGTPVEDAIRSVWEKGGVVGGMSAGCAVLGGLVYNALHGSVGPEDMLIDPFDDKFSITEGFLGLHPDVLGDVLFDTHFTERARLGRLPVMLARVITDERPDVLGIGVDYRTALCVSPDGTAEVLGSGSVTFVRPSEGASPAVEKGAPPTLVGWHLDVLTEGYRYDLAKRRVVERPKRATLFDGNLDPFPALDEPVEVRGARLGDRDLGEARIAGDDEDSALFLGALEVKDGAGTLPRTVLSTRTMADPDHRENRLGGVLLALSTRQGWLGIALSDGANLRWHGDRIDVRKGDGDAASVLVIDTRAVVSGTRSTYRTKGSSVGTRASVALEGARLHVLAPGTSWSPSSGELVD